MLYLVEMKWWDKQIGRQEIAPHFVSVYGLHPNAHQVRVESLDVFAPGGAVEQGGRTAATLISVSS
jgi:hypothetical protein